MPDEVAERAIERAIISTKVGGAFELGFFGGEPLTEAERVTRWINFAQESSSNTGIRLRPSLTTNGTIITEAAWNLMLRPELELSVSCDGTQEAHDRHRVFSDGTGSFSRVRRTLEQLVELDKDFRVVLVVRPGNLIGLAENVLNLRNFGVRGIDLSLDVWSRWTNRDVTELVSAISETARVWREHLPHLSINWFDEKAAALCRSTCVEDTARCGFGVGEIAVAPSGNLYPCERLVGEDADPATRLPGHVLRGTDFLDIQTLPPTGVEACHGCHMQAVCGTTCRCSNLIRTGDASKPDGLLCLLEKLCLQEVAKNLKIYETRIASTTA